MKTNDAADLPLVSYENLCLRLTMYLSGQALPKFNQLLLPIIEGFEYLIIGKVIFWIQLEQIQLSDLQLENLLPSLYA
jgi:hypothetical protein